MIILNVYVDANEAGHQQAGSVIVNLDHVYAIEFDDSNKSLDFWITGCGTPVRFYLSRNATEDIVFGQMHRAFAPLYEARVSFVAAVRATLDLRGI